LPGQAPLLTPSPPAKQTTARQDQAAQRASSAASASTLDSLSIELANELPMSKVVQLLAAIAPRGFALPKYLNLMSSDARNRARCAGLIFTDPDDAVTQREPTSHCDIHDDAPGLI
jgi:hypothetical protein